MALQSPIQLPEKFVVPAAEPIPAPRLVALTTFCLSAALLIPLQAWIPGIVAWLASLTISLRDADPAFRRRMAVLLGGLAVLAAAPINTDTGTTHFLVLGTAFLAVLLIPALVLGRTDPGVIRYRLWPYRFRWLDIFYVAISIPLSYLAFELYFKVVNPGVPTNWFLPAEPSGEASWRLFIGINLVGIWDELFFVNTVYAVLRSIFPYRVANAGQAVVYSAVLTRMAFTGIGPILVYIFALTQGAMFEESDNLLYVILVHLIVDAFLFAGILAHYYPGYSLVPF